MAVSLLDLPSQGCRRGSQVGCGPNVDRHRHSWGENLLEDYFIPNSVYSNKCEVVGVLGLLPKQKLRAIIRMLAYGSSANQVDKIARMWKYTTLESLVRFCDAIETLYTRD
ncbi:unnamed protein product [Prunus brigantina]